jgi:hypothetical protein
MSGDLAQAVRATLESLARSGQTVTYRDLAALVPVPPPHGIHKLTLALEDLVREDHAAGRPLIAALAISRVGDGIPGQGFFQLLAALGRYAGPERGAAAAEAHAAELRAALAFWGASSQAAVES